jgi:hypothetical protein
MHDEESGEGRGRPGEKYTESGDHEREECPEQGMVGACPTSSGDDVLERLGGQDDRLAGVGVGGRPAPTASARRSRCARRRGRSGGRCGSTCPMWTARCGGHLQRSRVIGLLVAADTSTGASSDG